MRDTGSDADQEAKARRQAQLEERHLEVYRNMHRLRDALYERYAALLKNKVQGQRSQLQRRCEAGRARSGSDTKQKQKKLPCSKLQHNDSYLKSLPKTSYYLIFDLQAQLAERGRLKTHRDVVDFYGCIKYNDPPSQLLRSLQDVRRKMLENPSAADLTPRYKTSEHRHPCTAEERGCEDDACLPGLFVQGTGSELSFNGSQDITEAEQMFPKMAAPTFATLQPNFMKNLRSRMPDLVIPEIPEKSSKAEIYMARLRQMHNLCLINMAVSQGLLDKDSDSPCWQDKQDVQELVLPNVSSKQEHTSQTIQAPLRSPKQPTIPNDRATRPKQLRTTSSSQRQSEDLAQDTAPSYRKTPEPLSIEDVCRQKHVTVIDRGFKLWRNYT